MSEDDGFERFSVYGFSIDYPKKCRVEFNPKSRHGSGDVVFHFPDRIKAYLSWGSLDKAIANFQTVEKHADNSINVMKKARNVRNFENVARDTLTVNRHNGVYSLVKLQEVSLGFYGRSRTVGREACAVHVHCPESSRYFVVYVIFFSEGGAEYEKTLLTMASSLKCH